MAGQGDEPGLATSGVADTIAAGTTVPDTLRGLGVGDPGGAGVRPSAPEVGQRAGPAGAPERGDAVGRFVILGLLGAGGMGLVYSAYDPHLDRKIALKLLRGVPAGGGGDARARLLREAQAMARINHPNVITVHEVGTHDDQVFLAMEFADAGTLRQWLATPRSRREVVAVFTQAGRGLAAAHAAGLVHRDFKPDNVLLLSDGGVRVTDFGVVGVAGAAAPPAVDAEPVAIGISGSTPLSAHLTRTGALLGTPLYMAPEQFTGEPATPGTDQFAFCVALYEALYGARPFPAASFEELHAAVLAGAIAPPPAGARVPAYLARALARGLSRDPARRYPSMAALLAALDRDPRRRRWRIAAGVGAALAIATPFALLLARAEPAAQCAAGAARVAAVWGEARRAQMRAGFAASGRPLAASIDRAAGAVDRWSAQWRGSYVDACEATHARHVQSEVLLDRRLECLDRRLADADAAVALLVAAAPTTVDHAVELATGLADPRECGDASLIDRPPLPADPAARAAIAAVRAQLGTARATAVAGQLAAGAGLARIAAAAATATRYAPLVAESQLVLGERLAELSDPDAPAALRAALRGAAEIGDEPLEVTAASYLVGALVSVLAPYAQILDVGELARAVARHARVSASGQVHLLTALGTADQAYGAAASARARFGEALAIAAKDLRPDDPAMLSVLTAAGNAAREDGRFAEARGYLERVVNVMMAVYGPDHPELSRGLDNLANLDRVEGKLTDAEARYQRALALRIAGYGPDAPEVGTSQLNLGTLFAEIGDHARAAEAAARALAIWEAWYGPDHPWLVRPLSNLCSAKFELAELAEARAACTRARDIVDATGRVDPQSAAGVIGNLGAIDQAEGKLDAARSELERALDLIVRAYGPDHFAAADHLANLASVLREQGDLARAEVELRRSLTIVEHIYGPDHARLAMGLVNLANLLLDKADPAGAEVAATRALAIFERTVGADHPYCSYAHAMLAVARRTQGAAADAVPHAERALAIREAAKMPPIALAEVRFELAKSLAAAHRDRRRVRELVAAAAAAYRAGGDPDAAAEVERWAGRR